MDERRKKGRAGMGEERLKMSPQGGGREKPPEERPTGERGGKPLVSRGKLRRPWQSSGEEAVAIARNEETCPE